MDIDHHYSAKAIADYGGLLEDELENDHYNEDIEGGGKYYLHKFSKHFFQGVEQDPDSSSHDEYSEDKEYSDKEQLIAFLLSFFVGWAGGGRFYVGDTITASIKFCLPLIVCCCVCFIGLSNNMRRINIIIFDISLMPVRVIISVR